MISTKIRFLVCLAVFCAVTAIVAPTAFSQDSSQRASVNAAREDDTNVEVQLYLIFATNREVEEGKMPAALDPILKKLHESLAFKHYSIAGTFLNRVRNNGRLDVTWVGGPFLVPAATSNPSFGQLYTQIKLATDEAGKEVVRMNEFKFGARVPIVTSSVGLTNASTGTLLPVVNYESIGLRTDISTYEDVPVIAGTLNVGASGDAVVVAVAVRRAN